MPRYDDERILIKHAGGSFQINSLPSHIVKAMGWKVGDKLQIEADIDRNAIVLRNINSKRTPPTIDTFYAELRKHKITSTNPSLEAKEQLAKKSISPSNPDRDTVEFYEQALKDQRKQAKNSKMQERDIMKNLSTSKRNLAKKILPERPKDFEKYRTKYEETMRKLNKKED